MDTFAKFQQPTRPLRQPLPEGSCDCQVHVFGNPSHYPLHPSSTYSPFTDADIDAALRMHATLGIERGVIVQATVHGTDHTILHDALAKAGPNYRGVALIDDSVSDQEIQRLHKAGVRGARFNFWKALKIAPTPQAFLRAIDRIKPYGWHAKIHSAGDEWLELEDLLSKVTIPFVIDHLGHPDIRKGADQPAVRMLLKLMTRENCWLLIANADRMSAQSSEWTDALPLIRRFVETTSDRCIWCTDWPHVKYEKPMPNDADLVELLYRAVPDQKTLYKILVDNPRRLFGF